MVPETFMRLCMATGFVGKTFFAQKIGEMDQK